VKKKNNVRGRASQPVHTAGRGKDESFSAALIQIAEAGSVPGDFPSLCARIHSILGEWLHVENFFVALYDENSGLISFPCYEDQEEPTGTYHQPMLLIDHHGVTGWVLRTGKTAKHGWKEINQLIASGEIKSIGTPYVDGIAVPIRVEGKTIGVVCVGSETSDIHYTAWDEQLLEAVAQQLAGSLGPTRTFEESRQRNYELQVISSIQEGLASRLDMKAIYNLVGEKILAIFDANGVLLYTFDIEKDRLETRYAVEKGQPFFVEPIPIPAIWKEFIRMRTPVQINNNLAEIMKGFGTSLQTHSAKLPKSIVLVPLMMRGEWRGAICLENMDREFAFGESDVRLLTILANSMSVALENARLWEQEKVYRKALQRELEIGREIQVGFLPEELPRIAGWEIAASLVPARQVAGDFYDAFQIPGGNLGLVIADVCDKGVGAALFMTLFRSLIRITANQETFEQVEYVGASHSTAERLQRAVTVTNNYITGTHGKSGMFATLFFGILDPRTGELTYINGGHESPLIIRSGRISETLQKTGPAVGAIPDCHFEVRKTQLDPGNMLFAFTDGAQEAKDPLGEFFGHERLIDALYREIGSADKIISSVESELQRYIASAEQFDDITLLVVKRQ
jgi:serine phosphatase RsbU (regulator of sigma subunit)